MNEKKEELVLSRRHATVITAAVVVVCTGAFVAGFFWGKRQQLVLLDQQVQGQVLADRVNTSVYTMNQSCVVAYDEPTVDPIIEIARVEKPANVAENIPSPGEITPPTPQYYAQLVGFGTQKAAQLFVDRMIAQKIPVIMVKKQSKTAKGKMVTWYQIVTEKYDDRTKLDTIVNHIAHQEKLRDPHIVTCS